MLVYQAGYRDFLKMSRHQRVFKSPFFALQGHQIERKKLKNIRCHILLVFWHFEHGYSSYSLRHIMSRQYWCKIGILLYFVCSNPMRHTSKKPPPYQSSYQIYETSWNHSSNHPCFFLKKLGTPNHGIFGKPCMFGTQYIHIYIHTYIHLYMYNIHLFIYIYIYM